MNIGKRKLVLPLLPLLGILIAAAQPCFATPYASVDYAYEQIDTFRSPELNSLLLPSGLALSCYGSATAGSGGPGCTVNLSTSVTATQSEDDSANASGGVELTNTSDQTIDDWLLYDVWFAVDVIVGVDNPATQYGVFELTQQGPGLDASYSCSAGEAGPPLYDWCATHDNAEGQVIETALYPEWGASLVSGEQVEVDLTPGASMELPAYTDSFYAWFVVPEPSSLALLASGLLVFAFLVPRRRLDASQGGRP